MKTGTCSLALICAVCNAACVGERNEPGYTAVPGGDWQRGAQLIRQFGCGGCHSIPGIPAAHGLVGPPLDAFARHTFIAGQLPNTPDNLSRWVKDPPAVEPGTAMPKLGLSDQQARDVAAYLYTVR